MGARGQKCHHERAQSKSRNEFGSEHFSGGNLDISTIADGNWEMLSGSQVKVFGKWTDLVNWPEYYKGNSQKNPTRIFKDVLTISASKVAGTKMMETFYLK